MERRAGRELGSLLGLGAISGSESASSEIPRHSTTAPQQHRSIATGHSASYPTTNNISTSVPGFFIDNFQHASALASLCLSSPSLHSLLIIPFARSLRRCLSPAACITRVHANYLPTSYSCLDLCPDLSPIRDSGTLAPSIRDCENLRNCIDHDHPR